MHAIVILLVESTNLSAPCTAIHYVSCLVNEHMALGAWRYDNALFYDNDEQYAVVILCHNRFIGPPGPLRVAL